MSVKRLSMVSLASTESLVPENEVPPQGPASLAFQFSAPATPSVVKDFAKKKVGQKKTEKLIVRTLSAPVDCGKKSSASAKSRALRKKVAQTKTRYRGMFISDEKAKELERIRDEQCKRRQETLKKKQEAWEAKARKRAAEGKKPMGRMPSFRCARLGSDVPVIEVIKPEPKKRGRPKKHALPYNVRRAMEKKQEKAAEMKKMADRIAGDHVDGLFNEEEDWQSKYIQQLSGNQATEDHYSLRQTTELRSTSVLNHEMSFTGIEQGKSSLLRQESLVSIAGDEEEQFAPALKSRKVTRSDSMLCANGDE